MQALLLLLTLTAVTIRQDGTPLRASCSGDAQTLTVLSAGTAVNLRFVLDDGSGCFKVSIPGTEVQGFVNRESLDGLERFDQERRSAPDAPVVEMQPTRVMAIAHASPRWVDDPGAIKLIGLRAALSYDPAATSADSARNVLASLDSELSRLSVDLGCGSPERVEATIQTRQAYLRNTDAAEWSAAMFDGRIRLVSPETFSDFSRILAHEAIHACLAREFPGLPAWVHEGLAQRLSGQVVSAATIARIRRLAAAHSLPRLENLAQSWSRMSAEHARMAYDLAAVAVDLLYQEYAAQGIHNILSSRNHLAMVTAELNRQLGL